MSHIQLLIDALEEFGSLTPNDIRDITGTNHPWGVVSRAKKKGYIIKPVYSEGSPRISHYILVKPSLVGRFLLWVKERWKA